MACDISLGRNKSCKDGIGGIRTIYIGSYSPFKAKDVVINDLVLTQIPTFTVYTFTALGIPSFEESITEDRGGKFYVHHRLVIVHPRWQTD